MTKLISNRGVSGPVPQLVSAANRVEPYAGHRHSG